MLWCPELSFCSLEVSILHRMCIQKHTITAHIRIVHSNGMVSCIMQCIKPLHSMVIECGWLPRELKKVLELGFNHQLVHWLECECPMNVDGVKARRKLCFSHVNSWDKACCSWPQRRLCTAGACGWWPAWKCFEHGSLRLYHFSCTDNNNYKQSVWWRSNQQYLVLFPHSFIFGPISLQVLQVNLSTCSLLLHYISLSVETLILMDS